MDFFDAVKRRGSYRGKFLEEDVSDEDLTKILDAGVRAPSGYNLQTTTFIAVRDAKIKKEIADLLSTPATRTAPVILVVLSQKDDSHEGLDFEMVDYGAATENIMLAITALGYAGVWMDGMVRMNGTGEKLSSILSLPEEKTVRTIVPFGKPAGEVTQKGKKPLEERAKII